MKFSRISLIAFVIILVAITGCKVKPVEIPAETFFFNDTRWGMTKSETSNALGVSEKSLIPVESTNPFESDIYCIEDYKYNGNTCDLTITFANNHDYKGLDRVPNGALTMITANLKDDYSSSAEIARLEVLFGSASTKKSDEPSTKWYTWIANKTYKDYLLENNMSATDFYYVNPNSKPETAEFTELEMLELLGGKRSELATLSVVEYDNNDADEIKWCITYDGTNYAYVSSFNK